MHARRQIPDVFDTRPVRNIGWETRDNNDVVLLVPRLRSPFLAKVLRPFVARPVLRVKLDAVGSFIWRQCDGCATVRQIAQRVREKFGGDDEPLSGRIASLIQKLAREHFVTINRRGV